MLASFVAFAAGPQEILLVVSRDILAPTLKRLSMFVLRAKVKLSDATAEYALQGLAGQAQMPRRPGLAPWAKQSEGDVHSVRLYSADGHPRVLSRGPCGSRPARLAAA
jgi:folate-binding Fe-S cluster repair protein YgfZ